MPGRTQVKRAAVLVTLTAGLCAARLPAAAPETVRLAIPATPASADYIAALRASLPALATSAGVHVRLAPWRGVGLPPSGWDAIQLAPLALDNACRAGTLGPIPWNALGDRAGFWPGTVMPCGVGAYRHAIVLTWDAAKAPGAHDWADMWNVTKLPGKRGLQRTPVGTLEIALMADGVAARDVYTVLRGPGGPDRAFRKLTQLRPYIVWWRDDADPMAILAAGAVLMTTAPDDRVAASARRLHRVFTLQPNGGIEMVQSWAINAATRHQQAVLALIHDASDPAWQAHMQARTGLAATVMPTPASGQPVGVDPRASSLTLDVAFWRDHRAALTARFESWLRQ